MKQEIIEETPLTMVELREQLEAMKEKYQELNFRANRTLEHAQQITTIDSSAGKKLLKEILALEIPRLREIHACKIVDLLPTTEKELKSALSSLTLTVSAENIKKILDLTTAIIGKKKAE